MSCLIVPDPDKSSTGLARLRAFRFRDPVSVLVDLDADGKIIVRESQTLFERFRRFGFEIDFNRASINFFDNPAMAWMVTSPQKMTPPKVLAQRGWHLLWSETFEQPFHDERLDIYGNPENREVHARVVQSRRDSPDVIRVFGDAEASCSAWAQWWRRCPLKDREKFGSLHQSMVQALVPVTGAAAAAEMVFIHAISL